MQVCLHHHMGTGIQTTAEIDKFMSLVDERVFLLFDTGHAWYSEGGEAPMLAISGVTQVPMFWPIMMGMAAP